MIKGCGGVLGGNTVAGWPHPKPPPARPALLGRRLRLSRARSFPVAFALREDLQHCWHRVGSPVVIWLLTVVNTLVTQALARRSLACLLADHKNR